MSRVTKKAATTVPKKLAKIARAKLKESGISERDERASGLKLLTASKTMSLQDHYQDQSAILIPYYDTAGKLTNFHRVRYLFETTSIFAGLARKYDMPKGCPPQAYFPKQVAWRPIMADPSVPLTITEGEFKALCACKHGITTIGLGGVWSWKSKHLGISFIRELESFVWEGRDVDLCFDSDISVKAPVRAALIALARELTKRGAACRMVVLPHDAVNNNKMGLDDYIVANGVEAYRRLEAVEIMEDEERRREMFANWYYVKRDQVIVDLSEAEPIIYPNERVFGEATRHLSVMGIDGRNQEPKSKRAAAEWALDPTRQVVTSLVYNPVAAHSGTRVITEPNGSTAINLSSGFATTPRRGNVKPMLKLIDALVGPRPEIKSWLLQWLAYPLQHPGTKLSQCVYIYCQKQGVGKSSVGEIMLDVYGRHTGVGASIDEEDFFGAWNEWIERGLFCLCDDLAFDGSKKSRSSFKRAITLENMTLKAKYRRGRPISNQCNFWFTGNAPGGLPLEAGVNRRALILEVAKALPTDWFLTEFNAWRHDQGGPSAWMHYLLNSVDVRGFSPRSSAPTTKEEAVAKEVTLTLAESWFARHLGRGGLFDKKRIWTIDQLVVLCSAECGQLTKVTERSVINAALATGWHRYGRVSLDLLATPETGGLGGPMERIVWFAPDSPLYGKANLTDAAVCRAWAEAHTLSVATRRAYTDTR